MFKDYYKILDIQYPSSEEEIKTAYRKQAMKWHPDKNSSLDATQMMQDIVEAYKILKDNFKKSLYDEEYKLYKAQAEQDEPSTMPMEDTYTNDQYDIHDEHLKSDIETARREARDYVSELIKQLKKDGHKAVHGAWDNMKGYVYGILIMSVVGLIIHTLIVASADNKSNYYETTTVARAPMNASLVPDGWTNYTLNNALAFSVPPTVELRHDYDKYTQKLKDHSLWVNTDEVVFQQKNLSVCDEKSQKQYCRIIMQYDMGEAGDFLCANETDYLDNDTKQYLYELAETASYPSAIIGDVKYDWVTINGIKVLRTSYKRNGLNDGPVCCQMLFLFNSKEMVQIILAYRESESDLWKSDFEKIVKTFNWKQIY